MKKTIGSCLIISSFLLLVYIYYPYFSAYFWPAPSLQISQTGSFIQIPKINAVAPIVEQVDAWNKSEYEEKLKMGVASAKGFAQPGEEGKMFLFAHSSLDPWEMTRVNTAFLRLGELNLGDQIIIYKDGNQLKYQVFEKKEVWPNQVEALDSNKNSVLILQTCIPLGTDLKRLLVFAKPV